MSTTRTMCVIAAVIAVATNATAQVATNGTITVATKYSNDVMVSVTALHTDMRCTAGAVCVSDGTIPIGSGLWPDAVNVFLTSWKIVSDAGAEATSRISLSIVKANYDAVTGDFVWSTEADVGFANSTAPFDLLDLGEYIKVVTGVKARASVRAVGIAAFIAIPTRAYDPACSYRGQSYATPGSQLFSLPGHLFAQATNGVVVDYCEHNPVDLPRRLDAIGELASGLKSWFALPVVPNLSAGSIEVYVDGVTVAPRNSLGETVWKYDAYSNSVHFPLAQTPAPGKRIKIRFPTRQFPSLAAELEGQARAAVVRMIHRCESSAARSDLAAIQVPFA